MTMYHLDAYYGIIVVEMHFYVSMIKEPLKMTINRDQKICTYVAYLDCGGEFDLCRENAKDREEKSEILHSFKFNGHHIFSF